MKKKERRKAKKAHLATILSHLQELEKDGRLFFANAGDRSVVSALTRKNTQEGKEETQALIEKSFGKMSVE